MIQYSNKVACLTPYLPTYLLNIEFFSYIQFKGHRETPTLHHDTARLTILPKEEMEPCTIHYLVFLAETLTTPASYMPPTIQPTGGCHNTMSTAYLSAVLRTTSHHLCNSETQLLSHHLLAVVHSVFLSYWVACGRNE